MIDVLGESVDVKATCVSVLSSEDLRSSAYVEDPTTVTCGVEDKLETAVPTQVVSGVTTFVVIPSESTDDVELPKSSIAREVASVAPVALLPVSSVDSGVGRSDSLLNVEVPRLSSVLCVSTFSVVSNTGSVVKSRSV